MDKFKSLIYTLGAKTVSLEAGTTQTVTNSKTNGVPGKLITLNSSSGGSAATLTCNTPNQYLAGVTMQDITFAGKGIFWYDKNSTVGTGVTGAYPWIESNLRKWLASCLN